METASKAAGGRRKTPLEKDIQRDIADWLRLNQFLFWRSNNFPAMGRIGAGGEMRFRSMPKDTPRGLPDLMIIKDGVFIGIEVKREGNKLRPEQADFGMRLVQHGAKYHVVHSLAEFLALPFLEGFKPLYSKAP